MNVIKSISLNKDGTSTLRTENREGRFGKIKWRQQMTFPKGELERALREAQVTVPWDQAK